MTVFLMGRATGALVVSRLSFALSLRFLVCAGLKALFCVELEVSCSGLRALSFVLSLKAVFCSELKALFCFELEASRSGLKALFCVKLEVSPSGLKDLSLC